MALGTAQHPQERLTAKHPGRLVDHSELEAELDLQDEPLPTPPPPLSATKTDSEACLASAISRLQQENPFNLDRLLAETEHSYIEAALRMTHGNVSQAARLLGINRTTLYNRMESFAREP